MPINQELIATTTKDFLASMTLSVSEVAVSQYQDQEGKESVSIAITMDDPKMLIGQGGQTLLEFQRILRMVLNKKVGQFFYVNVDINGYKTQKDEYLREIAREAAEQVVATSRAKELSPMGSYERRVLHQEFSKYPGVITESQGDGDARHIIVSPK